MAKELLPGLGMVDSKGNGLLAIWTYGCYSCPVRINCNSRFHLQEMPNAVRGILAGSAQCAILKNDRWAKEVKVLEPKEV